MSKNNRMNNPEYAKAYYLAKGEIDAVDKIVNYLQNEVSKQYTEYPRREDEFYEGIDYALSLIKERKWDPEWYEEGCYRFIPEEGLDKK